MSDPGTPEASIPESGTSDPGVPAPTSRPRISTRAFTLGALGVALLIACVVSIWASTHPDGLEFVAASNGFSGAAQHSATAGSPLANYGILGISDPWLSVAIAGAIGCAVTFGLAWFVGRAAKRRKAAD